MHYCVKSNSDVFILWNFIITSASDHCAHNNYYICVPKLRKNTLESASVVHISNVACWWVCAIRSKNLACDFTIIAWLSQCQINTYPAIPCRWCLYGFLFQKYLEICHCMQLFSSHTVTETGVSPSLYEVSYYHWWLIITITTALNVFIRQNKHIAACVAFSTQNH